MRFDVRLPFGMHLSRFGILPSGYGIASTQSPNYEQHWHRINANVCSSVVLPCFGRNRLPLSRLLGHNEAIRAGRKPGKVSRPPVFGDRSCIVMKGMRSLPT